LEVNEAGWGYYRSNEKADSFSVFGGDTDRVTGME
jgi:hypothetical protein